MVNASGNVRAGMTVLQYRYTGELLESVKICPRLIHLWAQLVCRGKHTGTLKGAAIVEFVRRAIGPIEDKTLALAD